MQKKEARRKDEIYFVARIRKRKRSNKHMIPKASISNKIINS